MSNNFAFTPAIGLRDSSAYPTVPASEAALRDGLQKGMDQLRDFINSSIPAIPPTIQTWIAPTLLNSWVNFGGPFATVGYYKDDFGIVHLRGMIKSGTTTNGTIILTLPAGYRPLANVTFPAPTFTTTDVYGRVDVIASGNITVVVAGSSYLSLDSIQFRAEQ